MRDVIQYGADVLKGPLAIVTQALMARAMNPGNLAPPGPPAPVPSPAPVHHFSQPPQEPQAPGTIPGATIPEAAIPTVEVPTASVEDMVLRGLFKQFAPVLLTALGQGADGYALADALMVMHGRLSYDQVCGLGKEKVIELAKAEPEVWAQLAMIEPKFNKFLFDYGFGFVR